MRKFVWATVVLLLAISPTLSTWSVGSSLKTLNIPVYLASGITVHLRLDTTVTGAPFRQEQSRGALVWVNDVYEIRITQVPLKGGIRLRALVQSPSGSVLPIQAVSLRAPMSLSGVDGVWTPTSSARTGLLISAEPRQSFTAYSAANYGIPYIGAASAGGENLLAIGLLRQDLTAELRAATLQNGFYELGVKAELSAAQSTIDHQFFVSTDRALSWFAAAEAYADWVDAQTKYFPFPVSASCYEPVYDTWYWSKDQVDENLYLEMAESASDVGMGMFLADSGWDAPTGEYNRWLHGRTGDYTPPAEKFTDLNQTFDLIRSQFNLQIQLWLQPFAVGRQSSRYAQTRDLHTHIRKPANNVSLAPVALPLTQDILEDVNLCPRLTATHQYLQDLFTEMATTYAPEGYWLDFIDAIPVECVAQHRHDYGSFGAGFLQAMETIHTTIRNHQPNPVVHFRAPYANLNNKRFANVWQPFDSPGNFDRMRLDAMRMSPFSKGIVPASDQMYWPATADDATIARFIMTSVMSGVPSVGANLADSRPSSVEIVKRWIAFYRKYQSDLTSGRMRPFGSFRIPDHAIESRDRLFAYIRSNSRVALSAREKEEIYLLNASDRSRISASVSVSGSGYELQALDHYLRPQGPAMNVSPNGQGVLELSAAVERGGGLVLTRR